MRSIRLLMLILLSACLAPAAAAKDDPFSFWGAGKKASAKPKAGKLASFVPDASASKSKSSGSGEIKPAESSKGTGILEATIAGAAAGALLTEAGKDTTPNAASSKSMKARKPVGGKIADRLKAFGESVEPDDFPSALPPPPPPPPPPAAWPDAPLSKEDKKKSSKKSKGIVIEDTPRTTKSDLPGSFPEDEDEIVEIIDMAPPKSSKKSKKASSSSKIVEPPAPPPPPPPPFVPMPPTDGPPTPPPEPKSSKKERPKINREGSSWGAWSATPVKEEKKPSSKPKTKEKEKEKESSSKKKKSAEKEDKSSSKGSTSDKERSDRPKSTPKPPRTPNVLTSIPPLSRSTSTRDKRPSMSGKSSSRRHSADMTNGIASPPPEMMPEMSSKAAKILGVGGSASKRKPKRVDDDDDIVMVGVADATPARDMSHRRSKVCTAPFHPLSRQ